MISIPEGRTLSSFLPGYQQDHRFSPPAKILQAQVRMSEAICRVSNVLRPRSPDPNRSATEDGGHVNG